MRNRLFIFSLIGVLASVSLFQNARAAGNTANTSADALAYVLRDISITKTQDLKFGEATTGDSAVTVGPNDAASGSGNAEIRPAEFTIGGEGAKDFTFNTPGTVTITTDDNSSVDERITVDTFTSNLTSPGTLSGSAGAAGSATLRFGATRAATTASQVAGTYSGSFTITVTYN